MINRLHGHVCRNEYRAVENTLMDTLIIHNHESNKHVFALILHMHAHNYMIC